MQLSCCPVWLEALTLPAVERRGQQGQLLHDLEEGMDWLDVIGAAHQGWAGVGSADGCHTLSACWTCAWSFAHDEFL